jgi:hypothetical protein
MSVGVNLSLGPWEPALRHTLYGTAVYSRSATRGEQTAALERRERREFETWSAYGSIYLMAAGLMNLLLILDAWDIAIGRKD